MLSVSGPINTFYSYVLICDETLKINSLLLICCVGLNVEVDRILEIACIVTDGKLTKSIEVFLNLNQFAFLLCSILYLF